MVVYLPANALYAIKDPRHMHVMMARDAALLYEAEAFASCMTLLVCFLDALAAGTGKAGKKRFERFVTTNLPGLCASLNESAPGKSGARTFYEEFRNGLAHLRAPNAGFALARATETGGKYTEVFVIEGRRFVGVNVDRVYEDVHALLEGLHDEQSQVSGG